MAFANLMADPELEPWEDNLLTTSRRGALEVQLEQLKQRLLEPILNSVESRALTQELRAVANEAAALAWFTVCPLLVFPTLLEEKVRSAVQWHERQESIRLRAAGGSELAQMDTAA